MKSSVLGLLENIITLLDSTLNPTHPDGTSETLRAYTSIPTNASNKRIWVYLDSEENVPIKDRHMVEGTINIELQEKTKENNAQWLYLYKLKEAVEAALAPTLNFNVSSGSDGSTISFFKGSTSQDTELIDGEGKVLKIILSVNYRSEWTS